MEYQWHKKKTLTATQVAEAELQQLRYEASLPKMKVSEAAKELQTYIEAHQNDDYLVKGFETSPKKNPFRKKKFNSCNLF